MPALPQEWMSGALGPALAAAAAAAFLARPLGGTRPVRLALAVAAAAAVFLPLNGLPLYGYARGVAGDVSVTTLALLLAACAGAVAGAPLMGTADRACLLAGAALAGLALYTGECCSGAGVYRLGWRPFGLVLAVLAAAAWAWASGRRRAALVPLLSLAAFDLGLLESRNLWDYLLDPLLFLYAAGWWLLRAGRAAARRRARPKKH